MTADVAAVVALVLFAIAAGMSLFDRAFVWALGFAGLGFLTWALLLS